VTDIVHALHTSSYWRSGPVLNSALSVVDMALWDIKGKRAGMPVWQLLGGRCRTAVPVYAHATGRDRFELEDDARRLLAGGYRHIRSQVAVPGTVTYGAPGNSESGAWDPAGYLRVVPQLFAHLRATLGDDVELLHDVHERLNPIHALRLAKELEQFRLFFLEDLLSPEDVEWLRVVRAQAATPLAIGELFTNQAEYLPPRPRPALRLHPLPHLSDRRPHTGMAARRRVRTIRHPDRLAWPGRCLPRRSRREPRARPCRAELRHPEATRILRHGTRGVPRHPAGTRRTSVAE
jgi:hypothetical protein